MKCHRDGCHGAAEFHVGLEVRCIGVGRHRRMLQAPSTIKVCRAHMEEAARYILSPANKSAIASAVTGDGLPLPDFSSAEVVFVPIGAKPNDFAAAREAGTRH